jgi:hypothetical protein
LSRTRHAHHIKFLWLQTAYATWDRADVLSWISSLLSRCSNLVLASEAKAYYHLEEDRMNQIRAEPMPYQWSHLESKISISTATVLGLAKICAGTLQHLHLNIGIPSFSNQDDFTKVLNALAQFRELRSIALCSNKPSTGDHTKIEEDSERFLADAFPKLERLIVDPNSTITQFFLYALRSVK